MLLQKLLRLPTLALEQAIEIAALQAHFQLLPAIFANLLPQHRTGGIELGAQPSLGIVELNPLLHDIITQSLGNGLGQQIQASPLPGRNPDAHRNESRGVVPGYAGHVPKARDTFGSSAVGGLAPEQHVPFADEELLDVYRLPGASPAGYTPVPVTCSAAPRSLAPTDERPSADDLKWITAALPAVCAFLEKHGPKLAEHHADGVPDLGAPLPAGAISGTSEPSRLAHVHPTRGVVVSWPPPSLDERRAQQQSAASAAAAPPPEAPK